MEFPEPVISVAIEPKTKVDQDKLGKALNALSDEDPTFQVRTDDETGQTIIAGMGELHLEVLVDRMMREFNVDANVGKPQVAYRETITQSGREGRGALHPPDRRPRPVRPRRHRLEPTGPGGGYEFVDKINGGVIPREYIPAVDAGIQEAMEGGVARRLPARRRAGHAHLRLVPRRRLVARWRSRSPARWRFKEAARKAKPVLLEPIMAVEVVTARGLHGRRHRRPVVAPRPGRGHGAARQRAGRSRAQVPLAEMFGYATDLRSRTQGRATYTMQFDSYQQVPESIAQEIIARVRGE